MRRMLRILSDHTSLFVLLALCLIYSVATFKEQHPTSVAAGRGVGEKIAALSPDGASVVIFVRATRADRAFAEAIQEALSGMRRPDVHLVEGIPRDLVLKLNQLGEDDVQVDYVATHYIGSTAGPLQPDLLLKTQARFPTLAKLEIIYPPSYYWPSFLTRENLINVINHNSEVAIIAIGMTLVIIAGGIDLSVGSVLAVSAVVTAYCLQRLGGAEASLITLILCALAGVAVTALVGAGVGFTSTYCNVPSFVVTLSMMMIARGAAYILAGSPDGITIASKTFSAFANRDTFGLPNPIWIMGMLYVVAHLLMTRTAMGRYVYAVGGNAEAARLSGVPVNGVRIAVFCTCGALAGLCGVINASRFETGLPAAGTLYELQVIAAVVVGGASLAGGSGRILGTLIGAMILAVIENGLYMAHVGTYEKMVVFGVLILAAVLLDQFKHRRR